MNNYNHRIKNLSKNIKINLQDAFVPKKNFNIDNNSNNNISNSINNQTNNGFDTEIEELFINNTISLDLTIKGNVKCKNLEVNELRVNSISEESEIDLSPFLTNQTQSNSIITSSNISNSNLNNVFINNSTLNNITYFQSIQPSFSLNNVNIPSGNTGDKGWLSTNYIRNLRTSLNETNDQFFFIDTFGITKFQTTNGNLTLKTILEDPNENADIIISSAKHVTIETANNLTLNSGVNSNIILGNNENINSVGSLGINNQNEIVTTVSDKRLKTNIKPIENAVSKVSKLLPVSYTWKDNKPRALQNINAYGFIAQDIKKILPEAVIGNDNTYLNYDDRAILAFNTKAIQELIQENKFLKEQILKLQKTASNILKKI